MAEIKIKVDGKELKVDSSKTLLKALLDANFDIPHMCYTQEIKPFGACRLCLIEVEENGKRKIIASCAYPMTEGMVVFTDSERIQRNRKMVAELLLARCPDVKEIKKLAADLGVEDADRFKKKEEGCILCGLCTRVCESVVGVSAISFVGRGPDKVVGTPFMDKSHECIGCGSCFYICPVNYIKMEDEENVRKFPQWKVEFEKVWCDRLGQKVPKKTLDHFTKIAKLPPDWFAKK